MRLLGRQAECEALDQLLTDTLAGRSRVTVSYTHLTLPTNREV